MEMDKDVANNFVELLRRRASADSAKTAVTFLLDGEEAERGLTYEELDLRARSVAVRLLTEVLPGDRVLLLQPPGLEFVISFFGCLYAGVIAVAAYPPRNIRHMPRIEAILKDTQATLILTSEEARAKIGPWLGERETRFRLICSEEIDTAGADAWRMPSLKRDTLALLQYTSGSTGAPRGVMVTHGNIMANEEMICKAFGHHCESSVASWLPIFHDMGLIGNLLQPLYLGTSTVLMSPTSFLQKPVRWLWAISRFRTRSTGAPNFAFDLCARSITEEQKATLDLSCLEIVYSGSEPIDARVLDRFEAAFWDCGLRRGMLLSCYGMAEATLLCTCGRPGARPRYLEVDAEMLEWGRYQLPGVSPRRRHTLVSCGESALGQDLRVVEPSSRTVLPEGVVGEIWLRGPHVTAGYWRKEAETNEMFHARLADGDGPFLRTADLGFVYGGELYVTGRIKDLIIIRGRNHYPQDIERSVEVCHPAIQPGPCAAFALTEAGVERLAVAAELKRVALKGLDGEAIVAAIRRAVMEAHELAVYAVALLKPLTLPKTSSGKIQRHLAKSGFLDGTLEPAFVWRETAASPVRTILGPPAGAVPMQIGPGRPVAPADVEGWLRRWVGRRLSVPAVQIDPLKPFAEFGIDSVTAVELSVTLGEWLRAPLPATIVWDFPNIRVLAAGVTAPTIPAAATAPPKAPATTQALESLSQTELATLLSAELETLR
jgi:acyl-CoA synthetase (AMP-forming)/AMP-acid ligase II/acyl carrier protein